MVFQEGESKLAATLGISGRLGKRVGLSAPADPALDSSSDKMADLHDALEDLAGQLVLSSDDEELSFGSCDDEDDDEEEDEGAINGALPGEETQGVAEGPARVKRRKRNTVAVSSFFNRETDAQQRKRKREALERADDAMGSVGSWGEVDVPNNRRVQEIIAGRHHAAGTAGQMLILERSRGFAEDFSLLEHGYNLCFYGLGSKQRLLHLLAASIRQFEIDLQREPSSIMLIHGFSATPGKLRDSLAQIFTRYLGQSESSVPMAKALEKLSTFIAQAMAVISQRRHLPPNARQAGEAVDIPRDAPAWERDLYIIVHNIDGEGLRSKVVQSTIATLASTPGIHLIASVDHVHAPLLWDHGQNAKFNFVMRKAHTMEPYLAETLERHSNNAKTYSSSDGAEYVLKSLTRNHRDVLSLLARHQLNVDRLGLTLAELYEACRGEMIVSNEMQLRRLLVEFKDHKVVTTRKLSNGKELLYIAWDDAVIRTVLGS